MKPLFTILSLLFIISGCSLTPNPVLVSDIQFKDGAFERCIKKLNVKQVAEVTHVICNHSEIKDVSELKFFTQVQEIQLVKNEVERIDVSSLSQLKRLTVPENRLTAIDVSANPQLEFLNISRNAITKLDLSNNTNLEGLYAYQTQLKALNIGHLTGLKRLGITQSKLTELDLRQSHQLEQLFVSGALLGEMDLSHLTHLRNLEVPNNQLNRLVLGAHPHLVKLNVRNNQLQQIDLSRVAKVNQLFASFNQLSTVDLSGLPLLDNAELHNNNISELDVQHNKQLMRLLAFNNPLMSLTRNDGQQIKYLSIEGTPVADAHFAADEIGLVVPSVTVLKGGKKPSIKDNFRPLYSQIIAPKLGDLIGFQYKVTSNSKHPGTESFPITVRVTHPPITPTGTDETRTVSSWPDTMFEHERNQALWQFSDPAVLVAGVWTFEIIYQEQVLAEHHFVIQTSDDSVFIDANSDDQSFTIFDSVINGTNQLCHDLRYYQCLNIDSPKACHSELVSFEKACKAKALQKTHNVFKYRAGNTLDQLKRYHTYYLACLADNKLQQGEGEGDLDQFAECLIAD
ncbi:leucine-rich repeat domain-containing protein [Shewanella waksmanii]|uniref:leucine-rich repeat domain-containing protein n=1 Tax=Shewanella waksmanii TaxID=213783 RepID=UPI003735E7BB